MRPSRGLFDGSYTGRPEPYRASWLAAALGCGALALFAVFLGGEYLQRLARYLDVPSFFVRVGAIVGLCVLPQATLIAYGLAYIILDPRL